MKTKMLVEDRDTGYLFLDAENAHEDAMPYEFTLAPGVLFEDVESDEKVVWMATDTAIRVVPRESVDFEKATFKDEWPIPSCTLCLTKDDYDTFVEQFH